MAHWTEVSDRCPLGYLFSEAFAGDNMSDKIKSVLLYLWPLIYLPTAAKVTINIGKGVRIPYILPLLSMT